MKKLIFLLSVLQFLSANAQQSLSIEDCQKWARENYPLVKRQNLINLTRQYTLENSNKGNLPQVQISGQASYQSDVTGLPIKIPNINIEALDKDQYKIYADISQNIYDGGVIKGQKKIANAEAEVNTQSLEVELYQLKGRINQIFFGILLIDEQLKQTDYTQTDLQAGLAKTQAMYGNGAAYRSNVDVMKAELLKNEQKKIELLSNRKAYLQTLGLFIQKKLGDDVVLKKPDVLMINEENQRPELKLYEGQTQLLEAQKKLINAKNLPKIGLFGQVGYGKPGLNMLKNEFDTYYIGGIRLSIPISGFYTKKKDLALLDLKQQEIELEKETFLLNQKFNTTQLNTDLERYRQLSEKDSEIISLRKSIKKASLAQLENGVITGSDYIRDVDAESQATSNKAMHEIQYLLSQYNLKTQWGQ